MEVTKSYITNICKYWRFMQRVQNIFRPNPIGEIAVVGRMVHNHSNDSFNHNHNAKVENHNRNANEKCQTTMAHIVRT